MMVPIITPDLLTGVMKVKYSDYMMELGFTGLHQFLTTFVASLSQLEKRKNEKKRMIDEKIKLESITKKPN